LQSDQLQIARDKLNNNIILYIIFTYTIFEFKISNRAQNSYLKMLLYLKTYQRSCICLVASFT